MGPRPRRRESKPLFAEELRKLDPALEARGRVVAEPASVVFRSPELRRLELARPLPGAPGVDLLPPEARRLLGWPAKGPLVPGAYAARSPEATPR